jgi:hypothetical protein
MLSSPTYPPYRRTAVVVHKHPQRDVRPGPHAEGDGMTSLAASVTGQAAWHDLPNPNKE